jgi:tetraacyldisaccharide 4'-kinase
MRGYAPTRRLPSRRARVSLREPDETDAYRRMFPDLPIVAQPDRISGLRYLLSHTDPPPTCVVLDDGFQHRKLARDLDVVLIDASRSPLHDHLLPRGWLREPVDSLRRADLIVLTHAELATPLQIAELERGLVAAVGKKVDAVARHVWTGLRTGEGDHEQLLPLDHILGKRIAAACAIGNPDGFLHSLRATINADGQTTAKQGTLIGAMVLPDHDPYDPAVISAILRLATEGRADAIVVTDKDWSKLRHLPPDTFGDIPILRPVLAMVFDRGQAEIDRCVISAARAQVG